MDIAYYNNHRGIYSPLIDHNGSVAGFWLVGNNYRNKSPLYGAYPPSYLKLMNLLFNDGFNGKVLHLFSGSLQANDHELTLDIRPERNPTYCMDASLINEKLPKFDLILADPPYDNNHEKYGTPKVNKKKVIKNCPTILKEGGYLVWLDTICPIWAKADGWKYRGSIGLQQSTNHKVRVATILQKVESEY